MQRSRPNSIQHAMYLYRPSVYQLLLLDNEEDWQTKIRQQIDDELNRRVRDALETPPLERIRRRQLQNQAKAAAAAAAEANDLNAHLDLTEKEREYIMSRKRQLRMKNRQVVAGDSDSDPVHPGAPKTNRFLDDSAGHEEHRPAGRVYTGDGFIQLPNQRPPHIQNNGISFDDWAFCGGGRNRPTYPEGVAPIIPHPKFKNIISPMVEPLYTSVPVGAKTFDTQVTPYTHKWRGICIVYDSEKSPRNQINNEQPSNPLVAPNLTFESRFESGNLRQARRVGQFEYELVLKTDVFTKRHTQWYYFRVQNMVPGIIYKFRIVNLLKRDSLYNHGMRPLLYSDRSANEDGLGWIRHGQYIREIPYYELEWQMEFPYEKDTCYLAHCYPYTHTDLKNDLDSLLADPKRSQYVKRDVMCETKAGNNCYLVTVTDFNCRSAKQYVVVSARVHPGESNSSWMLKGLIDHITGDTQEAAEIRKKFVYKIVPMLNPDGVIVGNYRCSLQARDLNRNYRHPTRESFPTVWNLKKLVEQISESVGVFVYCDFHGHSRKENVFMYGNNTSAELTGNTRAYLDERMLPFCISRVGEEMFCFDSCKFQIRRCKEATGRVVMYRHFNIKNSFTMEATFSGTLLDKNGSRHFNQRDFMNAGKYFAQGVLEYLNMQSNEEKETEAVLDLTKAVTNQLINASKLNDSLRQAVQAMLTGKTAAENPDETVTSEDSQSQNNGDQQPCDGVIMPPLVPEGKLSDPAMQELAKRKATILKVLDTITEETIAKCVTLLEQLSLPTTAEKAVSESSDSDSESEPEMPEDKRKKKKSKSRKRKDKKQVKSSNSLANQDLKKSGSVSASEKLLHKQRASLGNQDTSQSNYSTQSAHLPLIAHTPAQDTEILKGSSKCKGHWTNPYSGRSNGGIPCFSEERSMERAAKRMTELQKRMEEKSAGKQSFGPFSEREFGEYNSDIYYDEMAAQKHYEEQMQRSLRMLQPGQRHQEKVHMDFIKVESDEQDLHRKNMTPHTSQFEGMFRRSRTDINDAKRPNKFSPPHNHSAKEQTQNLWNDSEDRSLAYHHMTPKDAARMSDHVPKTPSLPLPRLPSTTPNDLTAATANTNEASSSSAPLPVSLCDGVSFTETSTSNSNNRSRIAFLTREYSDILASKLRSNQILARTAAKSQATRSTLLKTLNVNPLHSQPGLE